MDLQIAALIFLGGTKNLVSEKDHGGAERMIEDDEIDGDPLNPPTTNNPTPLGFMLPRTPLNFLSLV